MQSDKIDFVFNKTNLFRWFVDKWYTKCNNGRKEPLDCTSEDILKVKSLSCVRGKGKKISF